MNNEVLRLSLALLLALIVSLSLFYLMQSMISGTRQKSEKFIDYHPVDFVRLPHHTDPVETIKRAKPAKPQLQEEPEQDNMATSETTEAVIGLDEINFPAIETPLQMINKALAGAAPIVRGTPNWQPGETPKKIQKIGVRRLVQSSEVIPLVRIEPRYPRQAARQKLSGFVVVEFTIRPDGTVSKPKIVKSQPKRTFDKAALQAIRRWKFKPKLVKGKAVTQYASQTFHFKPRQ